MDGLGGWRRLEELGWRRHGVVTAQDLEHCGLARTAVRSRLQSGQFKRVFPGVFCFTAARATWEQRATGVLSWLGPLAALSHGSAAHLLRLDGFEKRPACVDVLVPRGHVNSSRVAKWTEGRGVTVHRAREGFDTMLVSGRRVTGPTRTLMDLAGVVSPACGLDDPLDDALDSVQRRWPGAERRLRKLLDELGMGRPGARRLGALLEERRGASTDSALEARAFRALRRTQLPRPTHQYEVYDSDRYVTRLDFAWVQMRVALLADSHAWHLQLNRFERDRTVATWLQDLGWHLVWVTSRSLLEGQWLVSLRRALEARAPQLKLL